MLSQFIDGGVGIGRGDDNDVVRDPYFYSQFMDNSSTSSNPATATSCAYDLVYDRMIGCGCAGGGQSGNGGLGGSPCVSLFLQWVKLVLGGAIKAYLSSPLCLAMLPLVIGLGVGFWMGRQGLKGSRAMNMTKRGESYGEKSGEGNSDASLLTHVSRLYNWLKLRLMLALIFMDPRRCFFQRLFASAHSSDLFQDERDERTRTELKASKSERESGVDPTRVPRHVAVIMDGNRRYGKDKYGDATRGHWDGSKTLIEFSKWCMAEGVEALTVYAFSTENWDRDPAEVDALMAIFARYCDELRVEAVGRGIRVRVLTTEGERIPEHVKAGIDKMVDETRHCDEFALNICLSYGSRGEIVNACREIAADVQSGRLDPGCVDEAEVCSRMLTGTWCRDPDVVIRTSGEVRLSNFLLWQAAYSELFFLRKRWPELDKSDLLEVIRDYARGRERRYGR